MQKMKYFVLFGVLPLFLFSGCQNWFWVDLEGELNTPNPPDWLHGVWTNGSMLLFVDDDDVILYEPYYNREPVHNLRMMMSPRTDDDTLSNWTPEETTEDMVYSIHFTEKGTDVQSSDVDFYNFTFSSISDTQIQFSFSWGVFKGFTRIRIAEQETAEVDLYLREGDEYLINY